ncbi:MAG: hypothetical protein LQ340_004253 [Diploschistes diacapsis]|nr:MAG: hypothetical protein LQ340_004253 [Diploschistes diacapsis]
MALARALTKRYKAGMPADEVSQAMPTRVSTLKRLDKPIDRSQISLPIELISSTNVMAYEAPDIHTLNLHSPLSALSSASSSSFRSYADSEAGASSSSSMTSPDISREPSPTVAEPKHTSYFPSSIAKPTSPTTPATPQSLIFKENIAPSVPSRAPSHTKKTHHALARKRSTRLSNEPDEAPAAAPAPLSPTKLPKLTLELPIQANKPECTEHPFGAELAQVKEVAEEFGVTDVRIWDEEEQFLLENGLGKYGVEDYLNEIQPLFIQAFSDISHSPAWL